MVRRYTAFTDPATERETKHGLYEAFHDNGIKSREVTYVEGRPDGEQTWWHTNGRLWMTFTTKKGVRDGRYEEFNRHGERIKLVIYKDGKVVRSRKF